MPTYMDIHNLPGVNPDDVAKAHMKDLEVQDKYGVAYHKYWVNEKKGKIYCLCTAPNPEAADAVHREAHGMTAERIMEVNPDLAEAFMGSDEMIAVDAALHAHHGEHDPGTRTILFTDIVNSTALTQDLGDEAAMALVKVHDRIVRDALAANGGHEVKHTGDGIMAAFVSAAAAVRTGVAIQQGLAQHRADHADQPLQVRIGVAAGEPIEHHADLFGTTVQLAARLCARAEPDKVLVSTAVAELCVGKGLPLHDGGEVSLKGFPQPVHVYSIGSDEKAS